MGTSFRQQVMRCNDVQMLNCGMFRVLHFQGKNMMLLKICKQGTEVKLILASICTYIYIYMHTYIHTLGTNIYTYIHTYIHTYSLILVPDIVSVRI